MDTIYALSSGHPPAAIAIVRISGPAALDALESLGGGRPEPRRATLVALADRGELLDRALVLTFPGPNSVTGEDLVELHLHGGRAVVAAVQSVLSRQPGLRPAEPGEFTRRAFGNGRIDLTEAEGLADLLAAETQSQRRLALSLAGGGLSRKVQEWTWRLLMLSAAVEARLDFSDEGDVGEGLSADWDIERSRLETEIALMLAAPPAERLKDGVRIVIAGPPNSGKSTLLNAIVGREAAITSEVAGTTRDLIEVPVAIEGVPFLLIDSAGLRASNDVVETIGVDRARLAIAASDLVLWLGDPADPPARAGVVRVWAKADIRGPAGASDCISVSAPTGEGMDELMARLLTEAKALLPVENEVAVNVRQRAALSEALHYLCGATQRGDLLITAEELRLARHAFDRVTGRAGVEDLLDALFGQFCIGK